MVKRGLGDSYEDMVFKQKAFVKIRAYLDLTKPASSVGVMLAIPFAAVIYGHLGGYGMDFLYGNWTSVLYASVTLFLLHGGSQIMNHAEDAEMDKASSHKQNRPIPAGIVSKEEARSIAWILIMAGVARAFITSISFGMFAVALAFFGVFYNLSPIRTKQHLWVNLAWQAASRGLLLYPAAFAAFGDPLNPIAWAMGIIGFLLVLSMQNTADFSDVEMDEKFGVITPAVHYGLDRLVQIMAAIATLMFVLIYLFNSIGLLPNFWSLYVLVVPIAWSLISLWNEPEDISGLGDNHVSWYVFYFCLAGLYIFPALQVTLF